jgi:hypothetical protein
MAVELKVAPELSVVSFRTLKLHKPKLDLYVAYLGSEFSLIFTDSKKNVGKLP